MSDSLVFMMGQYEARFPTDRRYARNHMWAQPQGDWLRFGFSMYAVRLLQDVYFLEWSVDAPSRLAEKQQIGFIESKKAESDLFSPATGELLHFNQKLLADPTAINLDAYRDGWLFEMRSDSPPLLSAAEYVVHLEKVWEVTQRTIKGQMNEGDCESPRRGVFWQWKPDEVWSCLKNSDSKTSSPGSPSRTCASRRSPASSAQTAPARRASCSGS